MTDISAFESLVQSRLSCLPFVPSAERLDHQAFASALASFKALSTFAHGMINAKGHTLTYSCGYLDSMTPNAFADLFDDEHVIGMHQALAATIIEFALYVFTQSDQFAGIGDAAAEDSPDPVFGATPGLFLLDKTLRGEKVVVATDKHRVPKDADRHVAAIYLAMVMIRYVWLHELAHCVNGHVLLLKRMNISTALNEVPDAAMLVGIKKAALDTLRAQTMLHGLELEADETALLGLCRVQMADSENIEGIAALDFVTRMEMSLLGAYLVVWLFEEYQRFAGEMHDQTHPYPQERLRQLVGYAEREIGPELEGFAPFHESICNSFNRLALKIPNMHRIDPAWRTATPRENDAQLNALLAPLRFAPAMPETVD